MSAMWVYLLISLSGLFTAALFAGFENGMVSVRKARLDHAVEEGSILAKLMRKLLDRPAMMLATVLFGTNLSHNVIAVFALSFVTELTTAQVWTAITPLILTLIVLLFCEIVPKVWFRQQPFARCRAAVLPVYCFYLVTYPFVRVITAVVHALQKFFPHSEGSDIVLLRDDFRLMLRESQDDKLITNECRLLLENSLEYDRRKVRGMMIPRSVVQALTADATLQEALELAQTHDISRFPVALPNAPNEWVGIFSIYDAIFRVPRDEWEAKTVLDYIRPTTTVTETDDAGTVLQRSRTARSPLLVVLDSEQRQVGVITPTDIVKPLFGDLDL